MVRPSTNWRPSSFMACPTAVRTTGSPRRFTTPWMVLTTPTSSSGASTLAGQHQGPGRGVDQRRAGLAEMGTPAARRDLVLDQGIDRLRIGHAQERFGQAHERDAPPWSKGRIPRGSSPSWSVPKSPGPCGPDPPPRWRSPDALPRRGLRFRPDGAPPPLRPPDKPCRTARRRSSVPGTTLRASFMTGLQCLRVMSGPC